MTLARGNLTQQHETYLAIKAGRVMRGWSQAQMAELMAEATGSDEWTENRITAIENGRKKIEDTDLRTFAEVQGYDVEFYWYGPPANRRAANLRDLNSYTPGYTPSRSREARWIADILNSERGIDHEPRGCIGCAIDPNFHVVGDFHDPIPGQTEFVIEVEPSDKKVA